MRPFLFCCPNTRLNVQAFVADDIADADVFRSVECAACRRLHLVNPKTGRVAGDDK